MSIGIARGFVHSDREGGGGGTIDVDKEDVLTVDNAVSLDFGPGFRVQSEVGPEARIDLAKLMNQSIITGSAAVSSTAWTNMPLADSELFGFTRNRFRVDLINAVQFRLQVRVVVAGAAGADLRAEFSPDDGVTAFANLDGAAGPEVVIGTTGWKTTGWVNLAAGAKVNDCTIRIMGKDGDGVADPNLSPIYMEFR